MTELKRCTKCRATKGIDEFSRNVRTKDGRAHWCKTCDATHSKGYHDARGTSQQKSAFKIKYDIDPYDYQEMFIKQEGKCAICGTHRAEVKRRFVVDHDHETGIVRGLLCANCNNGLGRFQEDMNIVFRAYNYLRRAHDQNLRRKG